MSWILPRLIYAQTSIHFGYRLPTRAKRYSFPASRYYPGGSRFRQFGSAEGNHANQFSVLLGICPLNHSRYFGRIQTQRIKRQEPAASSDSLLRAHYMKTGLRLVHGMVWREAGMSRGLQERTYALGRSISRLQVYRVGDKGGTFG